ncbi:MAG TPA: phosphatidylglycerophosphatase A [Opitutaceae bacterium]|nr:phosphatidylglycerophosphatase A [Opitutaceae bacterium]
MRLRQPIWPRLLPSSTVIGCATLGPVGQRLPAPGTWGSLAGLLYFTVGYIELYGGGAHPWIGSLETLLWSAAAGYLAVAFCGEAEFRIGRTDPGEVILDEFVAMPLCFLGWPWLGRTFPLWAVFLGGFGIFRLFDITKPLGIKKLQDYPGGWGIVLDDTAAALATCASLHLIRWGWLAWHPR